jgi:predicted DNA binding protein
MNIDKTEYLEKQNTAVQLLRVVSNRFDLINYLIVSGGATVTELQVKMKMNHHCDMSENLNELKRFEIVQSVKDGKNVIYSIVNSKIESINNALNKFSNKLS